MRSGPVLRLVGTVSRELSSGQFSVWTDQGQEVLAYVPVSSRLTRMVRIGDRVQLALVLEGTGPATITGTAGPSDEMALRGDPGEGSGAGGSEDHRSGG